MTGGEKQSKDIYTSGHQIKNPRPLEQPRPVTGPKLSSLTATDTRSVSKTFSEALFLTKRPLEFVTRLETYSPVTRIKVKLQIESSMTTGQSTN